MSKKGFTIVELLIVIVVIAILAAITIVAFNGVQDRAKASQASSALTQAKKKLEVYKIDSSSYPTSGNLALAGVSNTSSVYYQYTSDGATYCMTASVGGKSFNATQSTSPAAGSCSGQVDGGTITNIATNPSVETNLSGWSSNFGASGAGTTTRGMDGGQSGTAYHRMTWSTASTSSWGGINFPVFAVSQGESVTASVWVRPSTSQNIMLRLRANTWPDPSADINGPTTTAPPNTWTKLTVTQPSVPSGVTSYFPLTVRQSAGTWIAGDVIDHDSLMIVKSATDYGFADGASPNWSWNGTAHQSTSTGPPL